MKAHTIHSAGRGGEFLLSRGAESAPIFTPEQFSADDRLMARTAEDFLRREVMPRTGEIEAGDHELMRRLMHRAGELWLLGADLPDAVGGLGAGQKVGALIAEAVNPQQSFALTHEAHSVIAALPLLFFGSGEQKLRYLPRLASGEWIGSFALSEDGCGSDALAMRTSAELSPDGRSYILAGSKMWITNSAFADLFTVFAKIGRDVAVFLVERSFPGVSLGPEERKLGMHGTSTRRLLLDNVTVPAENVFAIGKGQYAAFCALNMGRFKLEAGAVGGLKYLLAQCASYAAERKTFGLPIAERGLVQHKLAEMAARTFGLESMVYRLAGDLDAALEPIDALSSDASDLYHRASEEFAVECSIVKVLGSEAYSDLADEAIQIHGGNGYSEEFPLARTWRDQRLLRIGEGANEIVRGVIVSTLLRRDKAGRLPIVAEGMRTLAAGVELAAEPPRADLDRIAASARRAMRVCAAALADALDLCGGAAQLAEMQEIGAAIADSACAAYGLGSISARLNGYPSGDRRSIAVLAGQVAALGYDEMSRRSAEYIAANLPGARLTADLAPLRFARSPLLLRRDLAGAVIRKSGYPL